MWPFNSKAPLVVDSEGKLSRQHISLRPTKLCYMVLMLILAIWVGAVNYQINVAYAICFWVVGFVGIAALMTWRQLSGLSIQIMLHDEVFAGEKAQVHITWQHSSAHRNRLFWWHGTPIQREDNIVWHRTDFADSIHSIWSIPITHRGYFPQPLLLQIATSAPFGLFHAESQIEWQTQAIAFPAPLIHQHTHLANTSETNETAPHFHTQGEDIAFLQKHVPGNRLQNIAWKTYAKRGELMDKVFEQPAFITDNTVISYQDYPLGTPPNQLASLLSYRVLQADAQGIIYTLILPRQTFTPQHGMREKCLTALALM